MNAKSVNQIIIRTMWICSAIISVLSCLLRGWPDALMSIISLFGTSLLLTGGYLLKIEERLKGILLLTICGYGFLGFSILRGGESSGFVFSFLLLGLSVLYFDSSILKWFSLSYLTGVVVTFCINPTLVIGKDVSFMLGIFLMLTYSVLAVILFLVTRAGNNLLIQVMEKEKLAQQQKNVILEHGAVAKEISDQLYVSIKGNSESMNRLQSISENVSLSAEHIKNGMDESRSSLKSLTQRVHVSNEQIEENYCIAKNLNDNYRIVIEHVLEGTVGGDKVKESMDEIEQTSNKTKESTDNLLQGMKKVKDILNEINAISAQTKLLALNASIEAARAGEYGSGFAVVANEIGSLSEQSHTASGNIEENINWLLETIEDIAKNVSENAKSVSSGKENLEALIACLQKIHSTSLVSESDIQEEFDIITNVKGDFENMVQELTSMLTVEEKNVAMVQDISDNINKQGEMVEQVHQDLEQILALAEKLDEQQNTFKELEQ